MAAAAAAGQQQIQSDARELESPGGAANEPAAASSGNGSAHTKAQLLSCEKILPPRIRPAASCKSPTNAVFANGKLDLAAGPARAGVVRPAPTSSLCGRAAATCCNLQALARSQSLSARRRVHCWPGLARAPAIARRQARTVGRRSSQTAARFLIILLASTPSRSPYTVLGELLDSAIGKKSAARGLAGFR
jgi:hypothetical protein